MIFPTFIRRDLPSLNTPSLLTLVPCSPTLLLNLKSSDRNMGLHILRDHGMSGSNTLDALGVNVGRDPPCLGAQQLICAQNVIS